MSDSPLKPSALPSQENPFGIHDWCQMALAEGNAFLQSQDGYDKIDMIIKAVMGTTYDDKLRAASVSQIQLNHMGKIALDLASSLTDIKPFWEYKTSNDRFEQQAQMGQKLASAWWTQRLIDLRFCDVIKYALAGGSGIAHLVYDGDMQDLNLLPEDPRDVLPIRPTDMISIQNCFGVIIRRERTVNYLKHMYPQFANRIVADREGSVAALQKRSQYTKMVQSLSAVSGFMANLWAGMGGRPNAAPLTVPVCDVYTIYVKDDSVNETGHEVLMGEANRNWSYTVKPGEPLYPRGRCIVMTPGLKTPLRDGPNIYWHGMFPVPKLTLDPWPWSWLGKSPLKDLLSIQGQIDRIARGIADKTEKWWRPDIIGDAKSVSKAAIDKIDTRRAGLRFRTQMAGNIQIAPDQVAAVQAGMEVLQTLIQQMKELSGTQELTSLVQLGQLPSSETIERMIESMSPAVRLRSRVMEAFMREVAMITLMNFFQFYTKPMRMAVLGQRGTTFEDFDYDPGSLVPDEINGLSLYDPRYERAAELLRHFSYQIAPGSLLAASEVTDKLMYLQLTRMGIVDPVTLLEKLSVPNLGLPPDFPQGILQRMQAMQQMGIGLAPGPASGGGAGGGPGRPASGQQMPRIKISESG